MILTTFLNEPCRKDDTYDVVDNDSNVNGSDTRSFVLVLTCV